MRLPEGERPQNAQEQIVHLEWLCGQQALELDVLRSGVGVLKKRGKTKHQEQDQRVCAGIQAIREVFAGYGYRRVTKALICSITTRSNPIL